MTAPGTIEDIDLDGCLDLIGERGIGRLAVDDGDGPVILPANYLFHGGVLHIRTAAGTKLAAADRRAPAAFEVDAIDEQGGWSVLLRGRLKRLMAPDGPGDPGEPTPAITDGRAQLIGLLPTGISGRRVGRSGAPGRAFDELGNIWWGRDGSDLLG